MSRKLAISGYMQLSRSAKAMFGQDKYAYNMAKKAIRDEFIRNKNVTNPTQLGNILLYCTISVVYSIVQLSFIFLGCMIVILL